MFVFTWNMAFTGSFVLAVATVALGHALWVWCRRPAAVAAAHSMAEEMSQAPRARPPAPTSPPVSSSPPVPTEAVPPPVSPTPPPPPEAVPLGTLPGEPVLEVSPTPSPRQPGGAPSRDAASSAARPCSAKARARPQPVPPSDGPPFQDADLAVRRSQAYLNLRELANRVEAFIFTTHPEGYPRERDVELAAVRAALQLLDVRCPACLVTSFDEAGSNGRFYRFTCRCRPEQPWVILRYPVMWRRWGGRLPRRPADPA